MKDRPVSDYRIGNIVFDDENEICRIEQLSSQRFDLYQQVSPLENKSCLSSKYPSNIYAIELTEEWLLNFGFKQDNGMMCYRNKIDIKIVYETLAKYYRLYPRTNKILYVHQLQNLYFTLTGTELEINL